MTTAAERVAIFQDPDSDCPNDLVMADKVVTAWIKLKTGAVIAITQKDEEVRVELFADDESIEFEKPTSIVRIPN
jgi:hypothetical protein